MFLCDSGGISRSQLSNISNVIPCKVENSKKPVVEEIQEKDSSSDSDSEEEEEEEGDDDEKDNESNSDSDNDKEKEADEVNTSGLKIQSLKR